MALVPSHQIKADKSIGLMREFLYYRDCRPKWFLEIGLDRNPWLFIPPEEAVGSSFHLSNNTLDDTLDEQMFARGHCYDSCFKDDLPEITLHSILGFGSRHVTKMKILKLTKGEMGKPCLNCKRNCFR